MPKLRKRSSVAIDTVPLPERIMGMATKPGKVTKVGAKYFLTVGKRKAEIPLGPAISISDLNKLAGKEVVAIYSARKGGEVVAICPPWPPKRIVPPRVPGRFPCFLCYIPAPDMIRRVGDTLRRVLIDKFVDEGIITRELAERIQPGRR